MRLTEAQIARLASLETDGGRLEAATVVEDAKKKSSPLHALFQWNKEKAAYAHWLQIAREIIGSVTVVVETQERTFRAIGYTKDPEKKTGYRATTAMRANPEASRQSLVDTLEVAAGHLRRAYDLSVVLGLQDEVDAIVQQVLGLKRSLEKAA